MKTTLDKNTMPEVIKTEKAIKSYGERGSSYNLSAKYSIVVDDRIIASIDSNKSFMTGTEWKVSFYDGNTKKVKYVKYFDRLADIKTWVTTDGIKRYL